MLDILARIATRPQPKITLGPVDMSCSFLVVDVTRNDSPIIYVSNTFTELTGYSEPEILGRNCRFLQAPPGVQLEKGGPREHTDLDSVTQMAQSLPLHRECQVTLVNYRKSGEAFINCVSIIPIIPGGNEPVRYHVGFQVDLAVQPLAIMKAVQTGSYVTNYSSTPLPPIIYQPNKFNLRAVSKDMSTIISRIGGISPAALNDNQDRQKLSMTLLAESPGTLTLLDTTSTQRMFIRCHPCHLLEGILSLRLAVDLTSPQIRTRLLSQQEHLRHLSPVRPRTDHAKGQRVYHPSWAPEYSSRRRGDNVDCLWSVASGD